MPSLRDGISFGSTELQDVVLSCLRDDVMHCSSVVVELRLGLVPDLQVDVERCSALSLSGWMNWPIASMMISAFQAQHCAFTQGVVKFAQVVGFLSSGSSGSSGGVSLELLSWAVLGNSLLGLVIGLLCPWC